MSEYRIQGVRWRGPSPSGAFADDRICSIRHPLPGESAFEDIPCTSNEKGGDSFFLVMRASKDRWLR